MRKKEWKAIITFRTTSDAMAFEKKCKEHTIPGRIIPVPREISAGCGLAWSAPLEERVRMEEFLQSQSTAFEAITELLF